MTFVHGCIILNNAITRLTSVKAQQMSHTIRQDEYGPYIRCAGFVFRPLFPVDYPPHPNTTSFATGDRVRCAHTPSTPLAIVIADDNASETWFSHGGYVRPRGSFRPSRECYKPKGFTWPGGVADRKYS